MGSSNRTRAPRAAVYVRLSRYRGADADASTSPETQRQRCADHCRAQGWQYDPDRDMYEDLDVSGAEHGLRLERPALARLRSRYDEYDRVVFLKLDRLARSVADFSTLASEAQAHGVGLVSVENTLDLSTDTGRFVAQILAAFAEMESNMIGTRIRSGKAAARAVGRWNGGMLPYGFTAAKQPNGSSVLVPDDAEIAIIREAAERMRAGASLRSTVGFLSERLPVRRKNAKRGLTARTVRNVLTNPALVGPAFTATEAAWLAERLEPVAPGSFNNGTHMLTRALECASCGSVMYAGTNGRLTQYRCSNAISGNPCPQPVTIAAHNVEAFVTAAWLDANGDRDETVVVPVSDAHAERAAQLRLERRTISRTLGAMTSTREQREALDQLDAIDAELDELDSRPRSRAHVFKATGRRMRQVWDEASDSERADLVLKYTGERLRILPANGKRPPVAYRIENIEALAPEHESDRDTLRADLAAAYAGRPDQARASQ